MRKVLLLRPDQAGDALKTIPVIRALLKEHSNSFEVSILCSPVNFSLFSLEPNIKAVLDSPGSFDVAINLLADPASKVGAMLEKIEAKEKWSVPIEGFSSFNKINLKREENLSESHLIANILFQALFLSAPLNFKAANPIPTLSESELSEVVALKKEKKGFWLGICPFSSIQKRSFSTTEIFNILRKLEMNTFLERIFIFGLESEFKSLKASQFSKVTFCSPKEFRTVGVYLQTLDAVVGVDTGLMHYALAFQLPVLVFGRGVDFTRWYFPLKPQDKVVARGVITAFPTRWERRVILKKWLSQFMVKLENQ